ncbi:FecR domain-containing protein [Steroidobacter sp. S1-65]|uniref:FecR domain-containing protein n=1 Tax=Steroidobacter gossypii TaxID=2805490 RepID=A0ABS1WV75_9GAMM|nr:FecR domain-containing protein [Steroidobacter gossypii]MBM0104858.1 FecR domain-containing protein [Steroidobacter gossypii]
MNSSSAQIEAQAAQWLARRDSGQLTATETAELAAWLDASTANRVAFIRLESAWRQADRLKVLGAGLKPGELPSPGEWRHSPYFATRQDELPATTTPPAQQASRRPSLRAITAVAASLVLAIVGVMAMLHWSRGSTYETDIGVASSIPMPDGSKVTLNTDSKIRVAVTDTERRVELEQGEAFFEVFKDEQRPFVVVSGSLRVVAVGTKFAVRLDADQVRVLVSEGRVRIEKQEGDQKVPLAQIASGGIGYTRGGEGVLTQTQPVERVEEALSWRTGFVVFHETPLIEAVQELNRYNTRRIVIEDPSIADTRISGNFRAANGDAFARLLEDGFDIRAEFSDARIVLRAK